MQEPQETHLRALRAGRPLSLEQKLPLIIGALLIVVIVALSTAAYFEVRRTSLRISGERLASITRQFRDLFQQSGTQLRTQVAGVASKPSVAAFAANRSRTRVATLRAAALADM